MSNMESWKVVLAWGCLGLFFAFPFAMPLLQIVVHRGPNFSAEYRYFGEYMRTVAAIIISLAGFNTAEVFKK